VNASDPQSWAYLSLATMRQARSEDADPVTKPPLGPYPGAYRLEPHRRIPKGPRGAVAAGAPARGVGRGAGGPKEPAKVRASTVQFQDGTKA
jgi:hypothetical protein